MMAYLWQARPTLNQYELGKVIEESASQYTHPDSLLGYGIPNYPIAMRLSHVGVQSKTNLRAFPNPFKDAVNILVDNNLSGNFEISLISLTGDLILKTNRMIVAGGGNTITLNHLNTLAPGMYILKISSGNMTEYLHMVKIEK
jgi:hypothetical protein